MVRLLEFTFADLDNITEVSADLIQESAPNVAFSCEQSVQWILVVGTLPGQGLEVLEEIHMSLQ